VRSYPLLRLGIWCLFQDQNNPQQQRRRRPSSSFLVTSCVYRPRSLQVFWLAALYLCVTRREWQVLLTRPSGRRSLAAALTHCGAYRGTQVTSSAGSSSFMPCSFRVFLRKFVACAKTAGDRLAIPRSLTCETHVFRRISRARRELALSSCRLLLHTLLVPQTVFESADGSTRLANSTSACFTHRW
jgi:hypothetical protein